LRSAACWAHLQRNFHDLSYPPKSRITREALDRIGKLCNIEHDFTDLPSDVCMATRKKLSQPWAETLFA
jgi:transposase